MASAFTLLTVIPEVLSSQCFWSPTFSQFSSPSQGSVSVCFMCFFSCPHLQCSCPPWKVLPSASGPLFFFCSHFLADRLLSPTQGQYIPVLSSSVQQFSSITSIEQFLNIGHYTGCWSTLYKHHTISSLG